MATIEAFGTVAAVCNTFIIALLLKGVTDRNGTYCEWREAIRSNVNYLFDIGGIPTNTGAAHIVEEDHPRQSEPWAPPAGPPEAEQAGHLEPQVPEMPSADDFPEGTFASEEARARWAGRGCC